MSANTTYNLSLKYLDGIGVPKDETAAFALCEQAATVNHHDAVLALGWHYLNGCGTPPNLEKAKWWYTKSARQGEPRAMFSLGQMAYDAEDFESARLWFTRASQKKHARSLYWLAKLHWHGRGVQLNRTEAIALANAAASQRDPEARRALKLFSKCRKFRRMG